ncbi:MAG TPA: tetratricopeptide repeat protein [Treponemataceae bacterium]|nr:tetratricopeptide repeat protein [Treponemataceae bacterium]
MKKTLCTIGLLLTAFLVFSQDPLSSGLDAYARSDWSTAVLSFRKAVSEPSAGAEPWYWLIMAEVSSGEYRAALGDIDRFTASFTDDARIPDVRYQKARIQYILGNYEESIRTFYQFLVTWPNHALVPAAYYWTGECLFASGRFDEARAIFSIVRDTYPQSVKVEAARYRIALIDQTGKEENLLKLLKMSHEESLRVIEDYQRRDKTYEQAVTAYQKRISDMMKDTRLGELEKQLADEKAKNTALSDRIAELEMQNAELAAALSQAGQPVPVRPGDTVIPSDINSSDPEKKRQALEALRNKAASLQSMYDKILDGGKK